MFVAEVAHFVAAVAAAVAELSFGRVVDSLET